MNDIISCIQYILSDAGPFYNLPQENLHIEFELWYMQEEDGEIWCLGPTDVLVRQDDLSLQDS